MGDPAATTRLRQVRHGPAGLISFSNRRAPWWAMLGVALMASSLLLAGYWDRGWIPHDEGTLAHAAERVLQGEIPHRDFDDPYSGGLSALNALAFRAFGVNLAAMRIVLLAVAVACVPAIFYIASRFTGYVGAAAVSFTAMVWSVANYPAALPSWYNLYFALFGTAALVRHIETGRARWLVIAGVLGGISISFKTSGLYYVAAALLLFVFLEQETAGGIRGRREIWGVAFSAAVVTALAAFVASLLVAVSASPGPAQLFQFVLPGTALAVMLAVRESRCRGSGADRVKNWSRLALPFLCGVALVIGPWLGMYAWMGALHLLLDGLFVLPLLRLSFASVGPVPITAVFAVLPLVLLAACSPYARRRSDLVDGAVLAAVATWVLWMAGTGPRTYRFLWYSLLTLIPVMVVGGSALLARAARPAIPPGDGGAETAARARRQILMLLLAMSATVSLVQFPFTAPVYFCYVAPFALLAALALSSELPRVPRMIPAVLLALYAGVGLLYVNPGVIYTTRFTRIAGARFEPLELERGGIRVPPPDNAEYRELVAVVRSHASSGYVYAAPDSPEVYFLSGLRNPTRTLFDFFETREARVPRTLAAIDRHAVSVIAINRRPAFSGPLPGRLTWELRQRFPHSASVGRFEVRWR
ncbi:MAG: hypothetical protein WEA80_07780 [Gemmatimonadaceae bacterium]